MLVGSLARVDLRIQPWGLISYTSSIAMSPRTDLVGTAFHALTFLLRHEEVAFHRAQAMLLSLLLHGKQS
jgi:hypothetical protein